MTQDDYDRMAEIHERDGYKCSCGKPSEQIAHRISKGKTGTKTVKRLVWELYEIDLTMKETEEIFIHHPDNVRATCAKCNDSYNILFNEMAVLELVKKIAKKHGFCEKSQEKT